jgi:hypothetical protein
MSRKAAKAEHLALALYLPHMEKTPAGDRALRRQVAPVPWVIVKSRTLRRPPPGRGRKKPRFRVVILGSLAGNELAETPG